MILNGGTIQIIIDDTMILNWYSINLNGLGNYWYGVDIGHPGVDSEYGHVKESPPIWKYLGNSNILSTSGYTIKWKFIMKLVQTGVTLANSLTVFALHTLSQFWNYIYI